MANDACGERLHPPCLLSRSEPTASGIDLKLTRVWDV